MNSMTGFGRAEVTVQHTGFTIEIKSVNHRYLDMGIKIPRKLGFLEEKIRQCLKAHIRRGRVDLYVNQRSSEESDKRVLIDENLCREYQQSMVRLSDSLAIRNDLTVAQLVRLPEVITVEQQELDETLLWNCLEKGVLTALGQLMQMRKTEGTTMKAVLSERLDLLKEMIDQIQLISPEVSESYRERLMRRIQEITDREIEIDENRLMMEIAMMAEKSSIDEEVVRFNSHLSQFLHTMEQEDAVGRKLDFLMQELNREINTIGSKAGDLKVNGLVVEIKSELEKIREQVQNIE
ncbi:TIGR00255 family protein [Anoxynatronum buryatiense]|uniref:TIGR00255 family protein n=2 Tax=Anoxynatronum buryatiense TaxID=489973 RepID=A0AA45WUI6_9CLOT|nr:TIGR00255 family protein [Anoxynatronum buryatiense]